MKRIGILGILILMIGCAGQTFESKMASLVGQLTIADAIQTWGPPTYERRLEDGTLLAWERREVSATSYQPVVPYQGSGGGFWGGAVAGLGGMGPMVDVSETRDILMLTFGPDGRLRGWKTLTR